MKRLLLLAALAATASAVRAQEPPAPPHRMFLSPSGEPFRPAPDAPDPFEAWFQHADANHDGRIDRPEFRADALAFFKRLDANGDGVIDGFELSAYEHKVAPELIAEVETRAFGPPRGEGGEGREGGGHGGAHRGGHGRGGGEDQQQRPPQADGERGPSGRGHTSLLNEPEPVSGADLDVDGRVSLAEWRETADRRFDMLDAKQAGALTRDSLQDFLPKPPKPGKRR